MAGNGEIKQMASSKEYLDFVLEQLSELDDISYKAMMGEYIIYYRGKIVGGVYDDRFLVKPVKDGYSFTVKAGERAMLYWVLQFATAIKVTAPESFVTKVKDTIAKMGALYA